MCPSGRVGIESNYLTPRPELFAIRSHCFDAVKIASTCFKKNKVQHAQTATLALASSLSTHAIWAGVGHREYKTKRKWISIISKTNIWKKISNASPTESTHSLFRPYSKNSGAINHPHTHYPLFHPSFYR